LASLLSLLPSSLTSSLVVVMLVVLLGCQSKPRNSTKASQGGIAHGMGMERLPLDLP